MTTPTTNRVLGGDYPSDWDGFVGQTMAKIRLRGAAASARKRKAPMEHIMLTCGEAGTGKTSLALLAAQEAGAAVTVVSGKILVGEARILLSGMDDGDVLVWDEIHQAVSGGKDSAGWLLNYMQDHQIVGPRGPEDVPHVTIIGATTDAGRLDATILDRFTYKVGLVPYTDDEGAVIAHSLGLRVLPAPLPALSDKAARAIAKASSNNPRIIRAMIITLRDMVIASEGSVGYANYEYDVAECLRWQSITPDGLTATARRYLHALFTDFGGQPAGEKALQDRLNEPGGLGHTERVLMQNDLIVKTGRGRVLSQAGIKRTRQLIKSDQIN